jgi:hypothetical protein
MNHSTGKPVELLATLSITTVIKTILIHEYNDTGRNAECCFAECCHAECCCVLHAAKENLPEANALAYFAAAS